MQELAELASSAGAVVVERVIQTRDKVEAATLIGSGKVRELAAGIASNQADAVIFDQDLTPTQQRNLEKSSMSKSSIALSSSSTFSPVARAPARAACRWNWPSSTICCRA